MENIKLFLLIFKNLREINTIASNKNILKTIPLRIAFKNILREDLRPIFTARIPSKKLNTDKTPPVKTDRKNVSDIKENE